MPEGYRPWMKPLADMTARLANEDMNGRATVINQVEGNKAPPLPVNDPRAEYEKWAIDRGYRIERDADGYVQAETMAAWLTWQSRIKGA